MRGDDYNDYSKPPDYWQAIQACGRFKQEWMSEQDSEKQADMKAEEMKARTEDTKKDYWWKKMEIPRQYWFASLKDYSKNIQEEFWKWEESRGVLLLCGPTGTGKTRFLHFITRLCYERMYLEPRYYNLPELLKRIQVEAVSSSEKTLRRIKKFREKRAYLLDELGVNKLTDFVLQEVSILLSTRQEWGRTTIITTNLMLDDIKKMFGDRFYSRLASGSIIKLIGSDFRLKERKGEG